MKNDKPLCIEKLNQVYLPLPLIILVLQSIKNEITNICVHTTLNVNILTSFISWFVFLKILFILFLERGIGREKKEKHQCVVAPHTPLLGTWPPSQAYVPTGN